MTRTRNTQTFYAFMCGVGRGQKIDKHHGGFALEYYKNNKASGWFKTEDGAYILFILHHDAPHLPAQPSVKSAQARRRSRGSH